MTMSQVTQALEYISYELNRYRQHIHLICASSALPCLLFEEVPTVYETFPSSRLQDVNKLTPR